MGTPADRRNQLAIAAAIIGWALSNVVTNEAIAKGASVWLILIPAMVAVLVVVIYAKFLRETDEYVRLLQYQGLALGFAGSLFVIALLDALKKAGSTLEVTQESATVMLVTWAISQLYVAWRHR